MMVSYAEPVVVNDGVKCRASDCESWWVKLSKWLWVMVSYAEPEIVSHGELF